MPVLASATSRTPQQQHASNTSSRMSKSSIINQPRKQQDATTTTNTVTSNSSAHASISNGHVLSASRCPHVVLIGELSRTDLDRQKLIELQQRKKKRATAANTNTHDNDASPGVTKSECSPTSTELVKYVSGDENEDDSETRTAAKVDYLQCEECDKRKNLWVCLREDCMFVGCGQDPNSNKHSNLHSMVSVCLIWRKSRLKMFRNVNI